MKTLNLLQMEAIEGGGSTKPLTKCSGFTIVAGVAGVVFGGITAGFGGALAVIGGGAILYDCLKDMP